MKDAIYPTDAKVECAAGHAGYVSTLIVNPVWREVTHLVIPKDGYPPVSDHFDLVWLA
jgi:hypothetical protein